jgi:hypothetical protein
MFAKLRVKKDLADGAHAGIMGYVEISEAGTVIGGTSTTTTAAGHFAIESDNNFELSTGHLNGVCVDSSVGASATITGTMSGIRIKKSTGKLAWPTGIAIEGGSCDTAIRVGQFAASAATTSAVLFTAAQDHYSDGQLSTVEAHGGSDANLGSGYCAKVGRYRHIINCTTAAHETYGLMGQVVVKDTTLTHLHAGLMGTLEGHTSGVVCNGAYTYATGAVMARVGGGAAITATKDVCGFVAFLDGAAMASGSCNAFAAGDRGTAGWTNALAVERATNLLKLPANGTAPVEAGAYGVHGGTIVRVSVLVGGAQYYAILSTAPAAS